MLATHAVVDDVLDRFRGPPGSDAACYRNHVYRGLNYQQKLLQLNVIPDEIALAWALHDIGIWTADWDYIGPSLQHVDDLAPEYGIGDVDRVRQMVELHHKVRPCQGEWVETFRVADRIDVSRGLLTNALTRADVRDVVQAFPYLGFHLLLGRTAGSWATKHPLRPLPMFRW